MGRLIDADKCPCISCDDTRNAHCTYEHRSCEKFCNWINNTAYDVEKVVAELEEKDDDCGCGKIDVWTAIEIVRKGGVDHDR